MKGKGKIIKTLLEKIEQLEERLDNRDDYDDDYDDGGGEIISLPDAIKKHFPSDAKLRNLKLMHTDWARAYGWKIADELGSGANTFSLLLKEPWPMPKKKRGRPKKKKRGRPKGSKNKPKECKLRILR